MHLNFYQGVIATERFISDDWSWFLSMINYNNKNFLKTRLTGRQKLQHPVPYVNVLIALLRFAVALFLLLQDQRVTTFSK